MNWIDGLAITTVVLFTVRGANRGAIWQLAAGVTLVLSIVATSQVAPHVEKQLPKSVDPQVRPWLAIAAIYLGLSILVFVFARTVRGWLEKARLLEFDRHWGAIVGAVKGCAAILIAITAIAIAFPNSRSLIRESHVGAIAKLTTERAGQWLPKWLNIAIDAAFDESLPRTADGPT